MIIAELLILATSLICQVEVDDDYEPKVGDRAVVGLHVKKGAPPGPRDYVTGANLFSTLDAMREALESPAAKDGAVKSYPDCYRPRPAAAVEVTGFATLAYTSDGEKGELEAVKVRLLEGEFKGRELYAEPWTVLRLAGKPGRRAGRRRAPPNPAVAGSKLILNDLVVESNAFTGMSSITGRFRNISDEELKLVRVQVSIEDASGKLLKSATAFCQPNEIGPGEAGSFTTLVETEPRAAAIKLEFLDLRKAIPWTDKSGKGAHP